RTGSPGEDSVRSASDDDGVRAHVLQGAQLVVGIGEAGEGAGFVFIGKKDIDQMQQARQVSRPALIVRYRDIENGRNTAAAAELEQVRQSGQLDPGEREQATQIKYVETAHPIPRDLLD